MKASGLCACAMVMLLGAGVALAGRDDKPSLQGHYAARNGLSGQSVTVQAPDTPRTPTIVDENKPVLADGSNLRLLRDRSVAGKDNGLLRAPAGTPEASAAPEPLGPDAAEGETIAIRQVDGTNTYRRDGRDLRAGKISCKRL